MSDGDQILFSAKPSLRRAYFYAFIYSGVVLAGRIKTDLDPRFNTVWLGCFAVLMVILGIASLRRLTTRYVITTNELQSHTGIIARNAAIVPLARVTNANANQSPLERILGLVNLRVDCAGGAATEIVFGRILKPDATEATRIIRELTNRNSGPNVKQSAAAQGE